MTSWRMLGATGVAILLLVSGCGGDDSQSTAVPSSTSASESPTDPFMNPGSVIRPFNSDPQLFAAAKPCKLVTSADLKKLFEGSFSNILGTDESPVTDLRSNMRACGYSSSDARIDHEGSYDITSVSLIVTTSLDDANMTLWRAELDAIGMHGGDHAVMPGADDLTRTSPGWYTARKGQVIIEVQDIYGELTDDGAKRVLAVALARLP